LTTLTKPITAIQISTNGCRFTSDGGDVGQATVES
jgi:hypothetical protein